MANDSLLNRISMVKARFDMMSKELESELEKLKSEGIENIDDLEAKIAELNGELEATDQRISKIETTIRDSLTSIERVLG